MYSVIRGALARFLRVGALAAIALTLAPSVAFAQAPAAHLERCFAWDVRDDRLVAVNKCKARAAIMFMLVKDQRVMEGEVNSGELFHTGVSREDAQGDWMYTACPAGHVPNVPFALHYKDVIAPSAYQCVRRQLI